MEYLPGDMLYRLQSNQLSVGAFASALISSGGSLLLACLDKDAASPSDQGESLMASSVSMCVLVCLQLVECAVELVECDSTSGMLIQQDSRPSEVSGRKWQQKITSLERPLVLRMYVCRRITKLPLVIQWCGRLPVVYL